MAVIRLIRESIFFAFWALWSNRLRSFLSLLGITIGIFAVISVFTFIDSWEKRIQSSLSDLGNNTVYIQKWPWEFSNDYPWWHYISRPWPQYSEYEQIHKRAYFSPAVAMVASSMEGNLKYGSNSIRNVRVIGVTDDYHKLRNFELAKGRYMTTAEFHSGSKIAVIGYNVAIELLGNMDPIGKRIKIFNTPVTVVGLFEKEGANAIENSMDDQVLVPMNFFRTRVDVRNGSSDPYILVQAGPKMGNEELKDELRGLMRSIRKIHPGQEDNFALNQISLIANQVRALFQVVSQVGFVIGFFSILVGGFGIANIMFVSVRERTNQIGIQKALGAKNYFILIQFLVEAIVLSILGGILGLIFVLSGVEILNWTMDLDLFLSLKNISIALIISSIIGILAGFVPAFQASKMNPVDAIRFV